MACAGSLALDIAEMKEAYAFLRTSVTASRNANSQAETHYNANQDHEAIYDLIVATNKQNDALDMLHYWYAPFYPEYMLIHIIEQHLAAPSLTMDSILETIWNSDKLRWFHFINYIDSMRAGIMNTEIYDTHLAEWYRHFSI